MRFYFSAFFSSVCFDNHGTLGWIKEKSCGIAEKTKYVYQKAKISCYLGIKLSHIVIILQWQLFLIFFFIFLPSCEKCLFGNTSPSGSNKWCILIINFHKHVHSMGIYILLWQCQTSQFRKMLLYCTALKKYSFIRQYKKFLINK